MTKAKVQIITLGIDDFDDFKKDKKFNEPWADRGIYLTLSPISAAQPNNWSISVTGATNLTTIRPGALALPKYDNGFLVLVRREDQAFTEYETDWVIKQLYETLRKTDLDFTCANPTTNPIAYSEDKQKELDDVLPAIIEELADYKYSFVEKYFTPDQLQAGEAFADETIIEKFAGFLNININYEPATQSFRFTVKDLNKEADTIFSSFSRIGTETEDN